MPGSRVEPSSRGAEEPTGAPQKLTGALLETHALLCCTPVLCCTPRCPCAPGRRRHWPTLARLSAHGRACVAVPSPSASAASSAALQRSAALPRLRCSAALCWHIAARAAAETATVARSTLPSRRVSILTAAPTWTRSAALHRVQLCIDPAPALARSFFARAFEVLFGRRARRRCRRFDRRYRRGPAAPTAWSGPRRQPREVRRPYRGWAARKSVSNGRHGL
jgi:hypothetical protein